MPSLIQECVEAFQCLPGVGPKSAQRMVFHLLSRGRLKGKQLGELLQKAMQEIGRCESCHTFSEDKICRLCLSETRDRSLLCVVESPADVMALEQAGGFKGLYFVLTGHLSPIDGIGPKEIGIEAFVKRLELGGLSEVILATNPTVEGEATAYYLAELVKERGMKTTRIAHGVPMGGELEYLDGGTLVKALSMRLPV